MSAATETLLALANYNSWRRGDETIEMPSPAKIGATIDDAVNLLRKYDDLKARAERAEAEVEEQCLLNGKGAEREASLLGQLERSAREIEQKRNLLTVAIKSAGDQATRAERAEAELANIRALADRRNKRYHVEDTTHQLVAALDQALDIARAELAEQQWLKESALKRAKELTAELAQFRELDAERARMDWLQAHALAQHSESISISKLGKHYSGFPGSLRAAIDAAMKEVST